MPYVYFIRSLKEINWVYVGSTEDIVARLKAHNLGAVRSTKSRRPFQLIYSETYEKISDARHREKELKMNRSKKDDILKRLNTGPIV